LAAASVTANGVAIVARFAGVDQTVAAHAYSDEGAHSPRSNEAARVSRLDGEAVEGASVTRHNVAVIADLTCLHDCVSTRKRSGGANGATAHKRAGEPALNSKAVGGAAIAGHYVAVITDFSGLNDAIAAGNGHLALSAGREADTVGGAIPAILNHAGARASINGAARDVSVVTLLGGGTAVERG